jgi:tRNA-specific 2-thiouridylase
MINFEQNQGAKLRVAAGLSGGVDSAVTALTLKQHGHDVFGVFMQNWAVENDDPYCTAQQDLSDAKAVADHLGIDFYAVNFAQNYWDQVFQYCLDEFAAGRTPNPDVLCNREIKFKALLDYALSLGADKLATGHYARIQQTPDQYQLITSHDTQKDQTYFLYLLNQAQLSKSLFPIGDLEKSQLRLLAKTAGLINHNKKDSTGICFIGERKFKAFLSEYLLAQPGNMETPEGKIVGKHDGVMFYTIGQRKGLHIGGRQDADDNPWYVLAKDVKRNVLIVGQGHDHPLLYSSTLHCTQLHWIGGAPPVLPLTCGAKTRYRQPTQKAQITQLTDNHCQVDFEQPQRAITPGQSVVFYQDQVCLGGGIIL